MKYNIENWKDHRSDYIRVSLEGKEHDSFRFIEGAYVGVVVTFGTFAIEEVNDGAVFHFDFVVDKCPEHYDNVSLETDKTFKEYLGVILHSVLMEAVEEKNYKIGKIDAGSYPEESDKR